MAFNLMLWPTSMHIMSFYLYFTRIARGKSLGQMILKRDMVQAVLLS